MNDKDFSATITVDKTPEQAFAAINDVRGWWTGEIEGPTDQLGQEFTYRYGDVHYSKMKLVELVPGKRIAWLVTESRLGFTKDKEEWNGTTVTFDIAKKGDKTEVVFTHVGLKPEIECFGKCSNAWGSYVRGSLRARIEA